ncbi:hypothetical protein VULLAG_LOCUS8895 [Vulpes lagopus]
MSLETLLFEVQRLAPLQRELVFFHSQLRTELSQAIESMTQSDRGTADNIGLLHCHPVTDGQTEGKEQLCYEDPKEEHTTD